MATLDSRTRLESNCVVGVVELKNLFMDYVRGLTEYVAKKTYALSGYYEAVSFGIAVANQFSLSAVGTLCGMDNAGHVLLPDAARRNAIFFENALATPYHVAYGFCVLPTLVERQAITGNYVYTREREDVGVLGVPDVVVDNGDGTMTFTVDSITEPAVSNAGRTVRVYMVTPRTVVTATAFEDRPVVWDGANNKITTVAAFGQSAPFSVVAADYRVALIGPRVARNTDLSTLPAYAYVGTVTGGGAGNPPASSDTTAQRVYFPMGISGLGEIVELDAHGDPKVRVTPDAADAATRQISVARKGAPADTVFSVDEVGRTRLRGFPGGAVSPFFDWVNGNGQIANIYNDAAGTIRFYDANVAAAHPSGIPLSPASPVGFDALLPGDLVRNDNRIIEVQRWVNVACANTIISGANPTDGGGLNLALTIGYFAQNGIYLQKAATFVVLNDGATNYVYLDDATGNYLISATLPLTNETDILICRVVTAAGAIVSIDDIRLPMRESNWRADILVGCVSLASPDVPAKGCAFAKVSEAVQAVDELTNPSSGWTPRNFRIVVVGASIETSSITIYGDGLTIEGMPGFSDANISHGTIVAEGDRSVFVLYGSRTTIRNLKVIYDEAVVPGAVANRHVFRVPSGSLEHLTIENIHVTIADKDLHGFFFTQSLANQTNWKIRGCRCVSCDFGIIVNDLTDGWIESNQFMMAALGPVGASGIDGIYVGQQTAAGQLIVRDNQIYSYEGDGIRIGALGSLNGFCVFGNFVSATGGHGIVLEAAAEHGRVIGNYVLACDSLAPVVAAGVSVAGDKNQIVGNSMSAGGAAPAKYALQTEVGGDKNTVMGNQFNGQAFNDLGASNKITDVIAVVGGGGGTVTVPYNSNDA